MSLGSYSQLILVIFCLIGQSEVSANRHRRQAAQNVGILPGNSNGLMQSNNVPFNPTNERSNQQQSNNNFLPASQGQGQGQVVRSRGFYSSPDFKPPSFNGNKPVGWFDTKYQNWVSNKDGQANVIDGKNAPPSSLQGKAIQSSSRQDGGPMFLEKVARQYASQGEKAYNIGKDDYKKGQVSVCVNRQNFNGYTFNKFYCPLPPSTGMNQLDRFCCGMANYQYCCNEQEYHRNQAGGYENDGVDYSEHRHSRHRHRSGTYRALAIILPIVGILVAGVAIAIVFLYYKRIRTARNADGKSAVNQKNDDYSAVPQDAPAEQPPAVPPRQHQIPTDDA